MHIEDQHGGLAVIDQPSQDHASQEGFTGAGRAEDACGSLHEFIQVHTDRMPLLEGVTDPEERLLPLLPKDQGDIFRPGQPHGA